jgi:hydroxyacylglutathione hydrolase
MAHLSVTVVPVTPFQQNCSVLKCEKTGKGCVIDPGGDLDEILAAVAEAGVELESILVTHAHVDHAAGVAALARMRGLPIYGPHPGDDFWIEGLAMQGQMFGIEGGESFTPTRWLDDGDTVRVGDLTLEVIHCPGHTPGHVVFFERSEKIAFVGDVLFAGSIGRTDFPQGDHAALISSIRDKLFPLGDDVTFVCGHGPNSTFGRERQTNPFVSDRAIARSRHR